MEDSPIGLGKWLVAMWQIVNCKNGASSYEIHRAIGVTQKTAWFLDRRIRFALGLGPGNKFSGQIEADETFIDGKARNMHKDKRARGVTEGRRQEQGRGHGIPERGEKVRTKAIGDTKKKTLHAEIRAHVLAGSAILPMPQSPTKVWTISSMRPSIMPSNMFVAKSTPMAWRNFLEFGGAGGGKGTHISVEPFHPFRCLDEQVFRYNTWR